MKKYLKIILVIFLILLSIIILDSLQAIVFNHSPLISYRKNDGENYIDKGIVFDTYYCIKEIDIVNVSIHLKNSKYTCPKNINTELENNNQLIDTNIVKDEDLVKIIDYIPNIIIDLKYATTDNFTGQIIYDNNEALLRYGTVKKLIKVQEELNKDGYTLLIWDAYRSTQSQFKLWEIYPDSKYVSNPNNGYSSHSKGNTIDISIMYLDNTYVEMPSEFDDFSTKANRNYEDVSLEAKNNSEYLESIMQKYGFKGYVNEWWHYTDLTDYEVI